MMCYSAEHEANEIFWTVRTRDLNFIRILDARTKSEQRPGASESGDERVFRGLFW